MGILIYMLFAARQHDYGGSYMNLQQLRYFHKIAALKNYTKASEELFVAQSSLSHSMAKLEHELGVPLFIKQGRNIVVTSYGENFDKHVAIILRELELAKNEIQQASNKLSLIHI